MAEYNPFEVIDEDNNDSTESSNDSFNAFESPKPEESKTETPKEESMDTFTSPNVGKKYNIVDMYWLINNKLFENKKLEKNEIALLTLGYNADFNNLRICLYEPNAKTFTEHAIFKTEAKQITSVNVFSETAHKVLAMIAKGENCDVVNFERVFSNSQNGWTPSPSMFKVNLKEKNITLQVSHDNVTYTYMFTDWQIQALMSVFKFMTNGGSWTASLK